MKKNIIKIILIVAMLLPMNVYADLQDASDWSKQDINKGRELGILVNDLVNNLKVNITRDDFCKSVVYLYVKENGKQTIDDLINSNYQNEFNFAYGKFIDVDKSDMNYKYIVMANVLGFVNGTSDNTFSPKASITREQAAKMILNLYVRLLKDKNIDVNYNENVDKFADDNAISNWAKEYVYKARSLKLMTGVGNNNFSPKGIYTKEQAFVTLVRADDKMRLRVEKDSSKDKDEKKDKEVKKENNDKKDKEAKKDKVKKKDNEVKKDKDKKKDKEVNKDNPPKKPSENKHKDKKKVDKNKQKEQLYNQYKSEIVRLVNEERKKVGAKPLQLWPENDAYAAKRADEIVSKFSHTRPNGSSCFSGLTNYKAAGENIAAGANNPQKVMKQWMNSPGHKKNILNPTFDSISVGIKFSQNSKYGWYWVQLFGKVK